MFSERLRETRKKEGISQKMLSIQLDTKQTTVSGWENFDSQPSYEMLCKIADALGVTTDYLLGRTDAPVTMHTTNTPYMQLAPIEKEVVERYRKAPSHLKDTICKLLDIEVAQTKHA